MTRSLGGRSISQRTRLRDRPRRSSIVTTPTVTCLTESFTGASWPIGADLTWEEGHSGYPSPDPPIQSDGSDAAKRTLHVVNNKLTIKAPDDTELPGSTGWFRAIGYARCTSELAGPDMRVSATIGGVTAANGFPEWILVARAFVHPDETLAIGFFPGWVVYFLDSYVFAEPIFNSVVFGGGNQLLNGFTDTSTVNPSFAWTPQEGDEVSVEVTGTGDDTVLIAIAGGVEAFTLNQGNNWGDAFDIWPGEPSSAYPEGVTGGLGLFLQNPDGVAPIDPWNHAAWDDVATLDDWSACSV